MAEELPAFLFDIDLVYNCAYNPLFAFWLFAGGHPGPCCVFRWCTTTMWHTPHYARRNTKHEILTHVITINPHLALVYKCAYNRNMPQPLHTNGKTRITIRIDDDLLDWFRAQAAADDGGNYQTLINLALREYVKNCDQPLEEILRRVIREELSASRSVPATFKSNTSRPR